MHGHALVGQREHLVRARARVRVGVRVRVRVGVRVRVRVMEAFSLTLACVTHALGAARMDSGLSSRSLDLPG